MNSNYQLLRRYTQSLPAGQLTWIGLRPARKKQMHEVEHVQAIKGLGLDGDRRCRGSLGSARQVTIISEEYIAQIEYFMSLSRKSGQGDIFGDYPAITPAMLRRNLVVSGINLTAIRHQRLRIGDVELETTALCDPCSRMEEALGEGGFAAMIGHGGLCAKIVRGGTIRLGNSVELISS